MFNPSKMAGDAERVINFPLAVRDRAQPLVLPDVEDFVGFMIAEDETVVAGLI